MPDSDLIKIYCDESCHLENDQATAMAFGAISCSVKYVLPLSKEIRSIKQKHGLANNFEIKWTKVSPAKIDFYKEIIDFFIAQDCLQFRGLVVPDKNILNHDKFDQEHDDWYYKMYYLMLKYMISPKNIYQIYIDIKDTRSDEKAHKLQDVLANTIHDFDHQTVTRVQQVRSHEVELLQLADLFIGALTYQHRSLTTSSAKTTLIKSLDAHLGENILTKTSSFSKEKFNILVWSPNEVAK